MTLSESGFSTPIALIIFNREETTREVLNVLRKIKPSELFIIADGPRDNVSHDSKLCEKTRAVFDDVDWPCNVKRLFHNKNLGCGHNPASGLDWVFDHVEECIILEDDCVPDLTFFRYCQEMLEQYRYDTRIMMVSGNNHLLGKKHIDDSYFFSINTQTHGWATWKRAWEKYDFYMSDWPKIETIGWLNNYLGSKRYAKNWKKIFQVAYEEANANPRCSYWDYQWTYACWKNHALNVIPSCNLVTNTGYGKHATHQMDSEHPLANLSLEETKFPLRHPTAIIQNYAADAILRETVYGFSPIYKRVFLRLLRLLGWK